MTLHIDWETAPRHPTLTKTEIHLWRLDLSAAPPRIDRDLLSADEQTRYERLNSPALQRRFLKARVDLRKVLGAYLGLAPSEVIFSYNRNGRPDLAPVGDLSFNLSHSGDLAVIGIHCGASIGIDIEEMKWRSSYLKIAEKHLEQQQVDTLLNLPVDEQAIVFLEYWTALEAKIKAHGGGVFTTTNSELINTSVVHFTPIAGWIGAVAINNKDPQSWRWRGFTVN